MILGSIRHIVDLDQVRIREGDQLPRELVHLLDAAVVGLVDEYGRLAVQGYKAAFQLSDDRWRGYAQPSRYGRQGMAVCALEQHHDAPLRECLCGFHAIADLEELRRRVAREVLLRRSPGRRARPDQEGELVVLEVALGGRVVAHEDGFRAQLQSVLQTVERLDERSNDELDELVAGARASEHGAPTTTASTATQQQGPTTFPGIEPAPGVPLGGRSRWRGNIGPDEPPPTASARRRWPRPQGSSPVFALPDPDDPRTERVPTGYVMREGDPRQLAPA